MNRIYIDFGFKRRMYLQHQRQQKLKKIIVSGSDFFQNIQYPCQILVSLEHPFLKGFKITHHILAESAEPEAV